jgi:hypothetical protein
MMGVSIGPGLKVFTRIFRPFKSAANVLAKDRTAALVAVYTLVAGIPMPETDEPTSTMNREEEPSGVDSEHAVIDLSCDRFEGQILNNAGICNNNVQRSLRILHCFVQSVQVFHLAHIALNGDAVTSKHCFGPIKLRLPAACDKDEGTLCDEPLGNRETNTRCTSGDHSDFSFQFQHLIFLCFHRSLSYP